MTPKISILLFQNTNKQTNKQKNIERKRFLFYILKQQNACLEIVLFYNILSYALD